MRPNDIRAELVRRGITGASIARELGYTKAHVSTIIKGTKKNARVQQLIADKLGLPFSRVWPERKRRDNGSITRKLKAVGGVKRVAGDLGVKTPTVSQVIHCVNPNLRIRQYIADLLGESVETLWPEEDQA